VLQVNNISFDYKTPKKKVLRAIDFSLEKGEHLCIMGESGCGKSTLLKIIYGLFDLEVGTIFWDDYQVLGPEHHLVPGIPFFKYVAQDFDLMPYISVTENIKKFLSRFYPEEAQERTDELLEVIEMQAYADEMVKNLSGGQQQRVAIARALAKEPKLLLLDEPFNQIDNFKKNSLRRKLFSYLKEKNISCIITTHDGSDALSFADKMIVIQNHKIIANNTPQELYKNPQTKYTASLFDDINELEVDGKTQLFYPHQIQIKRTSEIQVEVTNSYFKGFYWLIEVEYQNQKICISHNKTLPKGRKIYLEFNK